MKYFECFDKKKILKKGLSRKIDNAKFVEKVSSSR